MKLSLQAVYGKKSFKGVFNSLSYAKKGFGRSDKKAFLILPPSCPVPLLSCSPPVLPPCTGSCLASLLSCLPYSASLLPCMPPSRPASLTSSFCFVLHPSYSTSILPCLPPVLQLREAQKSFLKSFSRRRASRKGKA